MHGKCLEDLVPNVVRCVPVRIRKKRTVMKALQRNSWIAGIKGALGWFGFTEYLDLWDMLVGVTLNDNEDTHKWKPEASCLFLTRLSYRSFFTISITFEPWKKLWKSWAPGKCKTFVWLAIRNPCWTADHLQKRDLPHPKWCPLCDQEDENIQHILISCVFARQF